MEKQTVLDDHIYFEESWNLQETKQNLVEDLFNPYDDSESRPKEEEKKGKKKKDDKKKPETKKRMTQRKNKKKTKVLVTKLLMI